MKLHRFGSEYLLGLLLVLAAASAMASDWAMYSSKAYGFSMLIPKDAASKETEWTGGWGGLTAAADGVKFYGLAKLGAQESDDEIEKFALRTIGLPASAWKQIDQGKDSNSWARYRTFQATQGSKLVFGGYGVGPKGNYLLYLETTPVDFKEYRADYDKWYESIRLQ